MYRYCWFFLVRIVVLTFIAPTLFPGTFFLDQEAHILTKCIAEIWNTRKFPDVHDRHIDIYLLQCIIICHVVYTHHVRQHSWFCIILRNRHGCESFIEVVRLSSATRFSMRVTVGSRRNAMTQQAFPSQTPEPSLDFAWHFGNGEKFRKLI